MKIEKIDVGKIQENDWNPNVMPKEKFEILVKHIQKSGCVQPILIRPIQSSNPFIEFEIVDGAHRFRASRKAGLNEIDCVIMDLSESQAKSFTISMNNLRGKFDEMGLAG